MRKIILLVDDDPEEHELFASTLSEYNPDIAVVSAFNGNEALEMVRNILPSCIFLDINMPHINGLDVLRELKQNDNTCGIPVYMFSTSDGFRSKPVAMKLGAEKYFTKPASIEQLKKMFKEVLL